MSQTSSNFKIYVYCPAFILSDDTNDPYVCDVDSFFNDPDRDTLKLMQEKAKPTIPTNLKFDKKLKQKKPKQRCHLCKQIKSRESILRCTSNCNITALHTNRPLECRKIFCLDCLELFKLAEHPSIVSWKCPSCLLLCDCFRCKQSKRKCGI